MQVHLPQVPFQQGLVALGAVAVDRTLFDRTTDVATPALWAFVVSIFTGALLQWSSGERCEPIIATLCLFVINSIAALILGVVSSLKEGAEYLLIALSLGLLAGGGCMVLFKERREAPQEPEEAHIE